MTTIFIDNEPHTFAGPPGVFVPMEQLDALEDRIAVLTAALRQAQDAADGLRAALRSLIEFTVGIPGDENTGSWREDIEEVKAARAAIAGVAM